MSGELRNPWTRHRRDTVYENAWIEVWHDEVSRPGGHPGVYGVVHPRTRAVGIVAIDEADRVLLVGQYRYTLDRYSWEIPEGGAPFEEDTLQGAKRELAEETGWRATTWRRILEFSLSNSISDETGVLFAATGLEAGEPAPDETEELAVRWVPFDDAVAMAERGELFDSITQMGLFRMALERRPRA